MYARNVLAALFALALFSSASAQSCRSVDAVLSEFETVGVTEVKFLEGAEKQRALDFINAVPPETNVTFQIVLVGVLPSGMGVIGLGDHGHICHYLVFPEDLFERLTSAVSGERA
jgi:hypothetical protein